MDNIELPDLDQSPDDPLDGSGSTWGSFFDIVKTAGFVLVVAFIIRHFLVQPFVVDGSSMEPNFHDKEYILVDKLSYYLHEPKRGDVVVFHPPNREDNFIKRVIGLPGDKVEIRGHQVFINGELVPESYLDAPTTPIDTSDAPSITRELSSEEYFVLGDNRDHSKDSREIGPIAAERIIGRAWVVLFPLENLAVVDHPDYPNELGINDDQALVDRLPQ